MHRIAEFRFVSFRDDRETLIAPATSRAASNNRMRPAFLLLKMHEAGFSTGMSGNAVPPFAYHFAVYAMVISGERPRRDLPFACHIAAERQSRPRELSQRTSHSPFLSLLLEYPPGINSGLRNSRFLFPTHRRTKLYFLNEIPPRGGNRYHVCPFWNPSLVSTNFSPRTRFNVIYLIRLPLRLMRSLIVTSQGISSIERTCFNELR